MKIASVSSCPVRVFFIFSLVVCLAVGLYAGELTVAGSGASESIVKALAEGYEKTDADARVNVPPSIGTGGAIKGVLGGKFELGRLGRSLTAEEKSQGLKEILFARSAIVFFVHKNVKIKSLTPQQLCDIFSGKITDWKDVGGESRKIYVIARPVGESSRLEIENNLDGFRDITLWDKAVIETKDEDTIKSVEAKDGSISYGIISNLIDRKVNVIGINGIKYSDKGYRIFTIMGFCYKDKLAGLAGKFIDFIFSPAGEKIIRKTNSIPMQR